ncbi:MAG: SH3 domain-containing protein [Anaerolineae bacterium]|nr:SH3 domain-containing protein [Anaerolineae bacterium]
MLIALTLVVSGGVLHAQGGALNYGDSALGNLSATAPLALYTFSGSAGDVVTVDVLAITPGLDLAVSVNSPTQQQIATNGSSGNALTPGDAVLSLVLPTNGIYTALVSSDNGAAGDFLIRVTGVSATSGGIVGDDSPSAGTLNSDSPALLYVITPTGDGQTVLTITATDPAAILHVQAINSSGVTVADVTGSGVLVIVLPPGSEPMGVIVMTVSNTATDISVQTGGDLPGARTPPDAPSPGPGVVETPEVAPPSSECVITPTGAVGASVRSGPGGQFDPITVAPSGQPLTPTGRSGTGWFAVDVAGESGWISEQTVIVNGDCSGLPVVDGNGPAPTPTPTTVQAITPTPTPTPTAVPDDQPDVTSTPTATQAQQDQIVGPTPTPTSSFTPTATTAASPTFTPSYTPTSTTAPPSPTFTPSYTPTTPPATAPPDANFNNPLNLQLDSTGSVTDFVSYPGGDTQDRVRWDIIGMNQNASLSGGRARLTLAVSCFGTGTQDVTFFTGGQTFTCGQTIVDREVTYDSRTGQVTITAVAGENTSVQWVLTGTAVRVN